MDPVQPSPESPKERGDPVSKDPIANIRKLLKREPSRKGTTEAKIPSPKTTGSGGSIWRLSALISLTINILFLAFILWIGSRLFNFKADVVQPLLEGVYNAVGQMDEVEVQKEVQVHSDIPVAFNIPLQRNTIVTLSEPTRIEGATLSIRSATFSVDAPSTIDLPIGTQLPITMDLTIPVNTTIPVELTVPVDLVLSESDMQPAIQAIQDLIAPYEQLLEEAPDCWQMLLWGGECPE
jgi:hypothetical protein